jgi:ribose 5-phosphate isomerase A
VDDATRLARLAEAAAAVVEDGMMLGLGSGSTAEALVRALAVRVAGGLQVTGVPTSTRTERLATELGIPLRTLDSIKTLDFGIDGADEIDPRLDVVKGRGGALLFEKLVALTCQRYMIIGASEKRVNQLGTRMPLPVEIVPLGWQQTAVRLDRIGCRPTLRQVADGAPFITDSGHYILDCTTGPIASPKEMASSIKSITGVVDHGLFVGLADRAMVVEPDGAVRTLIRR